MNMTNELTTSEKQPGVPAAVADVTGNLVLVARDAGEMARSQQSLSGWFRAKEQLVAREVRDLEMCGESATHKIAEEIPHDEPHPKVWNDAKTQPITMSRHEFTAYVCCDCFRFIFGDAVFCPET